MAVLTAQCALESAPAARGVAHQANARPWIKLGSAFPVLVRGKNGVEVRRPGFGTLVLGLGLVLDICPRPRKEPAANGWVAERIVLGAIPDLSLHLAAGLHGAVRPRRAKRRAVLQRRMLGSRWLCPDLRGNQTQRRARRLNGW